MWIKPAAVLMLGTLLLVGCNNNKAHQPTSNETPMERVEEDVNRGVEDVTPRVNREETVPREDEIINEKTTTENGVLNERTTTDENVIEGNLDERETNNR
ncbi:hypothetical protein JFL43_12290 [Viridibacillus sp. YIM B01967]|uniref:Secreted protein n=1 Tax=Viridibacillus soli TaxID=2798301 RepID=A0ABS1H869_9BACL|nr:hypothetical protein [Viridibacillus soli]MBK3495615.1 hypothetical protein [Viridibacillus soli]